MIDEELRHLPNLFTFKLSLDEVNQQLRYAFIELEQTDVSHLVNEKFFLRDDRERGFDEYIGKIFKRIQTLQAMKAFLEHLYNNP